MKEAAQLSCNRGSVVCAAAVACSSAPTRVMQHPTRVASSVCRSDSSLLRLVKDYPRTASAAERCAFISQELGLQGPPDPGRVFAVGQFMPSESRRSSQSLATHAATQACAVLLGSWRGAEGSEGGQQLASQSATLAIVWYGAVGQSQLNRPDGCVLRRPA